MQFHKQGNRPPIVKCLTKSPVKQWEMVSTNGRTYLQTWRVASRLARLFGNGSVDLFGPRSDVMDAKGKAIDEFASVPLARSMPPPPQSDVGLEGA